jgi:SDR family mycofactocin-dependent oxidoreductase
MSRLEGKVAFITGAARGQGRSHAIRLAGEGADIIGVDVCKQIDSVPYALGTSEELDETARQVSALGRRMVAVAADVRDRTGLAAAFEEGRSALGPVEIVVANAGILPFRSPDADAPGVEEERAWQDAIDVNLTGVWHTIQVAIPSMIERGAGGAIVITSSSAGLKPFSDGSPGLDAYTASKFAVVGLMRTYANLLAPDRIRVNTVHPGGVDTPMISNPAFQGFMASGPRMATALPNALPIGLMAAAEISSAVAWLVSDEGRYVTGIVLPVDAGIAAR